MNADFISSSIAIGIRLREFEGGGGVGDAPSALMRNLSGGSALDQCSGEIHRARQRARGRNDGERYGGGQGSPAAVRRRQRERLRVPRIHFRRVLGVLRAA